MEVAVVWLSARSVPYSTRGLLWYVAMVHSELAIVLIFARATNAQRVSDL